MIESLRDFPDNIIAVACEGHVTRDDYETVLVPIVEKALERHDKIRLYYQIGSDFDGNDASGRVVAKGAVSRGRIRVTVGTHAVVIRATPVIRIARATVVAGRTKVLTLQRQGEEIEIKREVR